MNDEPTRLQAADDPKPDAKAAESPALSSLAVPGIWKLPGVEIGSTGVRPPPIAPVSMAVTAFIGPTLAGPAGGPPPKLESFLEFCAVFGGTSDLPFAAVPPLLQRNYVALAAQAFFDNGGTCLYIARAVSASGGNSVPPAPADYSNALATLKDLQDIGLVAAPGSSVYGGTGDASPLPDQAAVIHAQLIAFASRPSARAFAVLDPPPGYSPDDVQALRSRSDSPNAAIYYPWVRILDPSALPAGSPGTAAPPSGFVCGAFARSDAQRGVFKAPANLSIVDAAGLERNLTAAENGVLNAAGINCLRSFSGTGEVIWGARTTSSDAQWRYVNVRRYVVYLEASIERGTQWTVFEPNGPALWLAVTNAAETFLLSEWKTGALLGTTAAQAFFVRCDRTTMTQDDIDNGRLICLVGVAVLQPAEFVVIRIALTAGESCPPQ